MLYIIAADLSQGRPSELDLYDHRSEYSHGQCNEAIIAALNEHLAALKADVHVQQGDSLRFVYRPRSGFFGSLVNNFTGATRLFTIGSEGTRFSEAVSNAEYTERYQRDEAFKAETAFQDLCRQDTLVVLFCLASRLDDGMHTASLTAEQREQLKCLFPDGGLKNLTRAYMENHHNQADLLLRMATAYRIMGTSLQDVVFQRS